MPQLISYGNELIRINPANNHIEASITRGSSWFNRYSGGAAGQFKDLLPYGNEILVCTSNGIFFSTTRGSSWSSRCISTTCQTFTSLADGGKDLLANTDDGHLYVSTTKGSSWFRRR